jgi:hypothetical protein
MMMDCERCNKRQADWCLWIDNAEHQPDPKTRLEVCGHCLPDTAFRVSNFSFAENEDESDIRRT